MKHEVETREANAVDRHVGGRVRMRRKMLGISQADLASSLGLTFQQVQKYEHGANRISASKLYGIARTLQTPVSFFFDGLADTAGASVDSEAARAEGVLQALLTTPDGFALAEAFPRISQGRIRRQVLDLVRIMAADESDKRKTAS